MVTYITTERKCPHNNEQSKQKQEIIYKDDAL